MKLVINICHVPCPEEYYMGVQSNYKASIIDIPDNLIPSNVLKIIKGEEKDKRITNIVICE